MNNIRGPTNGQAGEKQGIPPEFFRNFSNDRSGIRDFRKMVLGYYRRNGRQMPWRETTDLYRILVSEIMLQQTQVERVLVRYPEFIGAFPDFSSLAEASLSDILRVWQGMGYNRRAIALRKCAVLANEKFGGTLPRDVEMLMTFPGIGRATASSIAAFAFDLPVVFIETNIRRVFIHFFFDGREDIRDAEILPIVEKAMDRRSPRVWYWALMDLGSQLKKTTTNPNRRSAHYLKQGAFPGSDRQIRGKIVRLLLQVPDREVGQIEREMDADGARIRRILVSLENEGFITRKGDRVAIISR